MWCHLPQARAGLLERRIVQPHSTWDFSPQLRISTGSSANEDRNRRVRLVSRGSNAESIKLTSKFRCGWNLILFVLAASKTCQTNHLEYFFPSSILKCNNKQATKQREIVLRSLCHVPITLRSREHSLVLSHQCRRGNEGQSRVKETKKRKGRPGKIQQ